MNNTVSSLEAIAKSRAIKRAICILSLGSRLITNDYILSVITTAKEHSWPLLVILLDTMEEVNLRFFEGEHPEGGKQSVRLRCEEIDRFLSHVRATQMWQVAAIKFSALTNTEEYRELFGSIDLLYKSNRRFRDLCLQQTFRNLHPRLTRAGVRNQRDRVVKGLVEYLLGEIALKLYLASCIPDTIEIAPVPEMSIMERVYAGEFRGVITSGARRMEHVVLRPKEEEA
ncbi:MAG: Spermidine/putrescine transporter ATPase [Verrucomicrobiales bacterium]|nr:Spermidine/putrescine transporter ATPase [Verrucomicrobiales bacterium]